VLTGIRKVKPLASRAGQVEGWRWIFAPWPIVSPASSSLKSQRGCGCFPPFFHAAFASICTPRSDHASPIWTPRSALFNMHASDVRPPTLFIRPAISLRFSAGAFPFVGPAYGSAEPDGGELGLHGVVFTLSKADWAKVQLTEAAGLSYSVEPVTVKTYDGDLVESLTLRAMHPFRVPEGLQGSISRPSERYSNSLPSFPVPPHPPPTHDVIISLVMVMHLIWCCCCCCCDR